jgi:ribosomal protein L37AE/L43A
VSKPEHDLANHFFGDPLKNPNQDVIRADNDGCSECGSEENEMLKQYRDGSWVCVECAHKLPQGTGWSPSDKHE